jgi:hypothetical protein
MRRGLLAGVCVAWAICFCVVANAADAVAPANDNFANAEVVGGALPLTVAGTTVGATREAGEPTPPRMFPDGHSIWFRWEAPATEGISVSVCGDEEQSILTAVYAGSTLGGLTEVADNNDITAPRASCRGGQQEAIFTAKAGVVYSIWVDSGGAWGAPEATDGEGGIDLEVSRTPRPSNDDFADPEPLFLEEEEEGLFEAREAAHFSVDNWGATKEAGEPDHRGNQGGASVWFEWTASRTGGVFVQSSGGLISDEPLLAVYTGSSVSALTPVPQIDSNPDSDYTFFAEAGTTYRIAVDGAFKASASEADMFEINGSLAYTPGNDDFEEASELANPLTGAPFTDVTIAGPSTIGATKQPGEPDHAGNPGGHSVWFEWTAPETGSVQLLACQNNFPTLLAVYMGSELTALTPFASGTNEPNAACAEGGTVPGEVALNIHEGVTYDIAVDGAGGTWGRFNFGLEVSDERLKPPRERIVKSPSVNPTTSTSSAAPPQTKIAGRKVDQVARSVTFRLGADVPESTFRCKLDGHAYKHCGAKVTYRHLAFGRHTFRAYAVAPTGAADSTPVKATFKFHHPPHHRR